MLKLSKYLTDNFFKSFFTLFSVLFIIASMVLLLTISNMTAVLKINISEFLYLYVLSLPEIIFYTLPLTFFITAAISIAKLFENSELIMVLSLGTPPKKIVRPFLYIAISITFLLLIITFLSIPTSNILFKNFINTKKTESQFNLMPSSIGQKIGNWSVFIKNKNKNTYKDIILYNSKKNVLIFAKKAHTFRNHNYFVLSLKNGNLYQSNDGKLLKLNFNKLDLNQKISITPLSFNSIAQYIKLYIYKTNKYLIIAFFPIIGFLFLSSISFFHNRYQKNNTIIYAMIISIAYYTTVFITFKKLYAILIIIPIFIIMSQILKRRIKRF
jgi:lipopolysaccharide export system permease protein